MRSPAVRNIVPANWRAAIIVCRKCEKKLGGGFGADGKQRLSKMLRGHARGGRGRKAALGVIESKCLKLCPKRAVTVVNSARPHEWQIIRPGTAIEEIERRLEIGSRPAAEDLPIP